MLLSPLLLQPVLPGFTTATTPTYYYLFLTCGQRKGRLPLPPLVTRSDLSLPRQLLVLLLLTNTATTPTYFVSLPFYYESYTTSRCCFFPIATLPTILPHQLLPAVLLSFYATSNPSTTSDSELRYPLRLL